MTRSLPTSPAGTAGTWSSVIISSTRRREIFNARGRGDAAGYPCIRVIGRYTYSGISENLFQGHRADSYYTNAEGEVTSYVWSSQEEIAQRGVNGWMASEGHRKNILTSHFSYEGIGVAFSSDDKIYVTQNFC